MLTEMRTLATYSVASPELFTKREALRFCIHFSSSSLHLGVRPIGDPRISSDILGDGGIWWDILGDLLGFRISLVDISWKRYPNKISEDILRYPIDLRIKSPIRIS